jgi:hypothetical protein
MIFYSIREAAAKLETTEGFVAAYVFGEGVKRYRSKLHPRSHLIDEDGFAFIREKVNAAERNREEQPTEIAC